MNHNALENNKYLLFPPSRTLHYVTSVYKTLKYPRAVRLKTVSRP